MRLHGPDAFWEPSFRAPFAGGGDGLLQDPCARRAPPQREIRAIRAEPAAFLGARPREGFVALVRRQPATQVAISKSDLRGMPWGQAGLAPGAL